MSQTAKCDLLGRAPLSSAVEDYLKAIYALREDGEAVVSTQSLANRMGVAPPSATAMLKKLDSLGLAHHEPYRGVALSPAGEKIALEVVRHHRIIETFLAEILGLSWDKVHDEAERLEHVISEEVEAKMAAVLGHPTRDPHGAPIPALDGAIHTSPETRLCDLEAGWSGKIGRVADESGDVLRHLSDLGLRPSVRIEVLRAVAAEGVLKLLVGGKEKIVGMAPARAVWVDG
jgi:DtxR family Mn-dependent transcriptional regulator